MQSTSCTSVSFRPLQPIKRSSWTKSGNLRSTALGHKNRFYQEREKDASYIREQGVAANSAQPTSVLNPTADQQTFNWFKHWWPVQFEHNLPKDRPVQIELLGEIFAVWMSKNGVWIAMRDVCPHRLAPLSEGRIEDDGTIMCSYHGWRFDKCGNCTRIPQLSDEKAIETSLSNPRSEVKTFPCKVKGGILWIWPDEGFDSFVESQETAVSMPEDVAAYLDKKGERRVKYGYTRVIPVDYTTLGDKTLDLLCGPPLDAYKATSKPPDLQIIHPVYPDSDLAVMYTGSSGYRRTAHSIGRNLTVTRSSPKVQGQSEGAEMVLICPISSGFSRIFTLNVMPGEVSGHRSGPALPLWNAMCAWTLHLDMSSTIDELSVFLKEQELASRSGGSSYQSTTRFGQWLADVGNMYPLEKKQPTKVSREELTERYHSHTKECAVCNKGLPFVKRTAFLLGFLSNICFLLTAGLVLRQVQVGKHIGKAILAAVSFLLFRAYRRYFEEKIIPKFGREPKPQV